MERPTRQTAGFTMLELIVAIFFLLVILAAAIWQKNDIDASQRDMTRKTAVNAFYYGLKQGYYTQHQSYPVTIDEKKLPYIDKQQFIDPLGRKIGEPKSDYHYQGLTCELEKCQKFEIRANLEKEADYIKTSSTNN